MSNIDAVRSTNLCPFWAARRAVRHAAEPETRKSRREKSICPWMSRCRHPTAGRRLAPTGRSPRHHTGERRTCKISCKAGAVLRDELPQCARSPARTKMRAALAAAMKALRALATARRCSIASMHAMSAALYFWPRPSSGQRRNRISAAWMVSVTTRSRTAASGSLVSTVMGNVEDGNVRICSSRAARRLASITSAQAERVGRRLVP